ncbi:CHASE domain-containing protein [Citromicrobium bathyomarinum]
MRSLKLGSIPETDLLAGETASVRWLREVAILAAAYFVAGYIGLQLAVPPGYATIIWPASGVALCGLLLRGRNMWPGIWLGSFSVNLFNTQQGLGSVESALPTIAVAAAIACGAMAQGLAGWYIISRHWRALELSDASQAVRFLASSVILPCMVAPSIGVGTLYVAGFVEPGSTGTNWLTWAGGDILGVLFLLPILLFSKHSPVPVCWQGRRLPGTSTAVAMCMTATLLLTFYAWQYVSEREYEASRTTFAALATDTEQALSARIAIYERALDASAAFAANSDDVSVAEWTDYARRLNLANNYPGMRGIGFFESVPAEQMPAFRERFSREFGNRFEIHPRVDRQEHFVINRIEPLEHNMAALGLDLAFEEGRRAAILQSRRDRITTMTRPIVLVQDEKQGVGFLFMTPVSRASESGNAVWAYSPLVAEEFLNDLTPREGEDYSFEVFFGDDLSAKNRMFATANLPENKAQFEEVRGFEMANQHVTLRWRSLPPFEKRVSTQGPTLVLASGIIISILLGILLTAFTRREGMVLRKIEEATGELEARNRMLELTEATAHVGHWQLDAETQKIYWSDEVYRIHGRKQSDPPTLDQGLAYYHPDDRDMVVDALDEATSSGSGYRFAARLVRDDGDLRHVEVIGQVGTSPDGGVANLFGVMIDRTDEVLMRDSLTKARDEARAADKAKTNFLANMSHEIRTPMNGVIGFTELALSEEEDPAQRRRLQMIADSSNALLSLLNDLLDFAKIEANQMVVSDEPTNLRQSLRAIVRLMEAVARSKNIGLSLDIDPALPKYVMIDKMRLRQIVLNLVGNALKFTESGTVKVTVTVDAEEDKWLPRILIQVRDTGIGIPAGRLASIFEKFTQADDTTARKYGGTGLGLPISAQLAELMGGTISVESQVGIGSCFVVTLPLRETDVPEESLSPDSEECVDCGHPVALRILVAEDNPVNQELTMAMVEKAGHMCDLAHNGQEALEMVIHARSRNSPYDMVLMDMQMPVLDGLASTRAIRQAGFDASELPIIAVTANAYAEDVRRCHEAGMQAHIPKPLRLDVLCATLGKWAGRIPEPVVPSSPELEPETDPRLNQMFDERVEGVLKAISAVLSRGEIEDEERTEIAGLLHQIAGVAAYFDQAELGNRCREWENDLLEQGDPASWLGIVQEAKTDLKQTRDSASSDATR